MKRVFVCLLLCLLTGCRPLAAAIVLPSPEEIVRVAVTDGEGEVFYGDSAYASILIGAMEGARPTRQASIHDAPAVPGAIRVEFAFKNGGSSRVFVYTEHGQTWLEQPYQGIYRVDAGLLALLEEGA